MKLESVPLDAVAADMFDQLGRDGVLEILGAWLGMMHRTRPRLRLAKPEPRIKAPEYLAFVRQLPCSFCQAAPPSDPHHYGPRGIGQKADDIRSIPVCRFCHDACQDYRIDPREVEQAIIKTLVAFFRTTRMVEAR